MVTSPNHK